MSFYSNNFLVHTDRKGCISVKNIRSSGPCKNQTLIISSLNYRQRELVITSGSNRLSPKDTIRSFMSRMKEWGGVGLRVKKPVCILVPFYSFIQRQSFALSRVFVLFSTWIKASFLGKALYKGGLSREFI